MKNHDEVRSTPIVQAAVSMAKTAQGTLPSRPCCRWRRSTACHAAHNYQFYPLGIQFCAIVARRAHEETGFDGSYLRSAGRRAGVTCHGHCRHYPPTRCRSWSWLVIAAILVAEGRSVVSLWSRSNDNCAAVADDGCCHQRGSSGAGVGKAPATCYRFPHGVRRTPRWCAEMSPLASAW